jgi:L-lactate dehydrogenase complex protein LldG
MSARDDILGRVRAALGRHRIDAATVRQAADALLQAPASIRPELPAGSLVDAFVARVTSPKVAASAERIASLADLPAAVAAYLQQQELPAAVAVQPHPDLAALDWTGFALHPRVAADEAVAVGLARAGIAETGSLVFHSSPQSPVLSNFLPLHHIVALRNADIVGHLEDYAAAIAGQPMPRNLNLITGASGTTDIEGSLVLGAHGPRFLHVVIVED